MYTFPQLLKRIREESKLTQDQLATALGVSEVLITMLETGQKEVSKNFVVRLAEALKVSPNSITPFIFDVNDSRNLSGIESQLIKLGERLQTYLIQNKAKNLKKYAY